MKKAVVTGGLGFIGSHLCERLLEMDYSLEIIDNGSNSTVGPDFFDSERVTCDYQDIKHSIVTLSKDVDIVFHLAAPVGPTGVLKYAGKMGYITTSDVYHLIEYCNRNNCKLIDISTSEVYGHKNILSEDSEKIFTRYEVRTEYAAAKLTAEIMLSNSAKVSDLSYHIIRPFNVAGPRQKPDGGFVLPRFVIAALTDQPITIYGDGLQRRAFTDVRDICDAIIAISFSDYKNEIWNIGNPKNEMNIRELAWLVASIVDKGEIISVDPKKLHGELFSEAMNKIPDIKKITNLTGWEPKISVEKTIEDIVEYYKEKIEEGYSFRVM
jgi:nucleoside-diphosphate-sugar epimerase